MHCNATRYAPKKSMFGTFLVIGVFFALFGLTALFTYGTVDRIDVTVTDKERVVTRDNSYYRVFTETEVLKNADNIFFFKFNSSDVQGRLRAGETYTVKVNGLRVPFLSMYRNILAVE